MSQTLICPKHKLPYVYRDTSGNDCCIRCLDEKEKHWKNVFHKQCDKSRKMRKEINKLKRSQNTK